jgi:hypothetical protein
MRDRSGRHSSYPATFFACFLTFAHRFFAAFTIAALPAADKTRFFTPTTSCSEGILHGLSENDLGPVL